MHLIRALIAIYLTRDPTSVFKDCRVLAAFLCREVFIGPET